MTIDRSNAGSDVEHELPRLTRRRLLTLAGGTVGIGLLTASGVAHADLQPQDRETLPQAVAAVLAGAPPAPAATTMAPLAGFQQAAQSGFVPVNSTLTFGAPTDLASGWDGTVWAIDGKGAPHVYDPLTDGWQLHGTGIDGAALIEGQGPAVYFRGGEVFIADGQHTAQALFTVWPDLPPSYQLGVQGAAWAEGKLVLFRGGTYLTAPWPPPALASSEAEATPTAAATPATVETPTAAAGTSAPTQGTPTATPSPASTPSATAPAPDRTPATPTAGSGPSPTPAERATPEPAAASHLYHAALLPAAVAAAATGSPSPAPPAATSTPTHAAPSATPAGHTPTGTPTSAATHIATPTARATSTPPAATPTPAATPSPAASATGTPAPTNTPIPTDTPTPLATDTPGATDTPTTEATPTSTPAATSIASTAPLTDYVPVPLTGVPGWPQTANWQDAVIDGVYSTGAGGGPVLLIRGGEVVALDFPGLGYPARQASGPGPISTIPDFAQLPADWQANGFDAGFFAVAGPAAGSAYVTRGAQAMVYRLQVGAEELATPTPDASGTPEAALTPATDETPETSPTAVSSQTPEASPTAEGASTAEATPTAESSPTAQATSTRALTATTAPTSTRPATPAPGGGQADTLQGASPLYHAALAAAAATATPGSSTPTRAATAIPTTGPAASPSATATHPAATASATPTIGTTATAATTPIASGTPTAATTPALGTPSASTSPTGEPTTSVTPTPSATPSATGASGLVALADSGSSLHYIAEIAGDWPSSWHPRFQHAPNGRTSGLWGATVEGQVVSFDGTRWTRQPGDASSVAAGVDGAVFAVGQQDPQQLFQWHGSGWSAITRHSSALAQVSVGDQGLVWARDEGNGVHQLVKGQLQPVPQLASATHLAANYDGTLWSCTGADPHALRLASDVNAPPAAVPAAGTVQKVASTGFGTAHCLTNQSGTPQVYRYDSPYVFRTAGSYITSNHFEQGLGSLYATVLTAQDAPGQPPAPSQVVALDAHTGRELSRSAASPGGLRYTAPTFDAAHETIIVGLTTAPGGSSQAGRLLGLDARDLSQVRWSLALPNNLPLGPGRPTLQGNQLCVSDNVNNLVMYDTGVAPGATTPSHRWTYTIPSAPQDEHRLPPPVLANGSVYAAWWLFSTTYGFLQLWLAKLDPATGTGSQTVVQLGAGKPPYVYQGDPRPTLAWEYWMGQFAPLLASLPGAQQGQSRLVLFVNGGTSMWGVDVDAFTTSMYELPGSTAFGAGGLISTGFGFANGVVWFGDTAGFGSGTLYGVEYGTDGQLKAAPNTPAPLSAGSGYGISTTPVLYTNAQGETAVLLSVADARQPGLLVFDPTSGNVVSIPTQGTYFLTLSTVSNGVVYGGGTLVNSGQGTPQAQVFAINVDAAVQELRDFVIDSQLQQDFDDPSQPTHNANGVARYQTHLTLVDDTKAPLANTPVKLWADVADTTVLVNGQSYTIGPDDDQYAAVQTGTDGTLVIVSGSTRADGSDKADTSAAPLRAWAPFMDPYERMLVYRDREFHNRVASAHATDAGQAGADDPTRANLQTAQTYGDLQNQGKGTSNPLFTDQEKQNKQPQNVATAIQKMTGSVGTAPPKTSKRLTASWSLHAVDTPGKYVPYSDTPGAQYSPVNVAADRTAVVLRPGGLSYASSNDGSAPSAYADLSPADATLAIDALDGVNWHSSQYAPPRVQAAAQAGTLHLGSWWNDFWSWLKGAVATVTHVIVAVAEDIYAGIRVIVNGVAHVFRAIIAGIEEAVQAIGAFFVELGKLIEQMIEALSVLFQFGHIIDTHNILKNELLNRINGVAGNSAYPGLAALVTNTVLPKVDTFFQQGEQAINTAFNDLANKLAGTPPTALKGAGATAHTAYSATPKNGGGSSSTVTQSTWGQNKFSAGAGAGGAQASLASSRRVLGADDPITGFLTDFANRVSGNGDLTSQWNQVKSGAQGLGNATSPSDFLKQGLAELLRILALVLDGALAVTNAFLDGLFGKITDLVQAMFDPNSGLLTETLDIPVLSWLYQLLFGEPLTILNAVTLITAIPVTILWRVVEGQWPAQSLGASATSRGGLGTLPFLANRLFAYASAIITAALGFLFGFGDAKGTGNTPLAIGRASLAGSMVVSIFSIPSFSSDNPADLDWIAWGWGLGIGLLNILGSHSLSISDQYGERFTILGSILECLMSFLQACILGEQFKNKPPADVIGDVVFGINVADLLPGFVNPAKLVGEVPAIVVGVLDVIMGLAGAVGIFLANS